MDELKWDGLGVERDRLDQSGVVAGGAVLNDHLGHEQRKDTNVAMGSWICTTVSTSSLIQQSP